MSIKENLLDVKESIERASAKVGNDVTLCAVTKTHPVEAMNEAIDLGVLEIGENKVQEISRKFDDVKECNWNLIGHLQTNKVKEILELSKRTKNGILIQSVDSMHLALEIDKRAANLGIVARVLIQVNVTDEESKFGVSLSEFNELIENVAKLKNIKLEGLMYIAPDVEDIEEVRPYFRKMNEIYLLNKEKYGLKTLSMGMSHDYEVAIEEGANMVRVGTKIFGARDYSKTV